jgi:hypothetical protein
MRFYVFPIVLLMAVACFGANQEKISLYNETPYELRLRMKQRISCYVDPVQNFCHNIVNLPALDTTVLNKADYSKWVAEGEIESAQFYIFAIDRHGKYIAYSADIDKAELDRSNTVTVKASEKYFEETGAWKPTLTITSQPLPIASASFGMDQLEIEVYNNTDYELKVGIVKDKSDEIIVADGCLPKNLESTIKFSRIDGLFSASDKYKLCISSVGDDNQTFRDIDLKEKFLYFSVYVQDERFKIEQASSRKR